MDAIEQLKDDLRRGRIEPDRFVELLSVLQQQLQASQQLIAQLKQRIAELEKQLPTQGKRIKFCPVCHPLRISSR
jgi:CII-binding regulator of phage lambda lysogenization HflD